MTFALHRTDPDTSARRGTLVVRGKTVETPAFMPVGTRASVKGVHPHQVKATGSTIILCNTYHLHLRPGEDTVARLGGLHRFMGWDGAILTDSGGYQVFSLAGLVRVEDEGVEFRSHLDGAKVRLNPEGVVGIQAALGSDIAMVLDHCVKYPSPREVAEDAEGRTARWAERSAAARHELPEGAALFGIVQGSTFPDLRARSAARLVEIGFDGYAVGGLSVGEGKSLMREVLEYTVPHLPGDRPRYLMGVGEPDDIVDAVARGIDLFDCVLPTRNARNATLFTRHGPLKLRNAAHRDDPSPPDPECTCPLCSTYSLGYIRHLFNTKEMLGPMLATLHNLHFYQELMRGIRAAIEADAFPEFRRDFLAGYK